MIEFKNLEYQKEYKELAQFFLDDEDYTFIKNEDRLEFYALNYHDEIIISDNFSNEKSNIKVSIYNLLENYTKMKLPWGILVGVNPIKKFRKILNEHNDKSFDILSNKYLIDKSKIDLGLEVIKTQDPIFNKIKDKTSIYIDIPFCTTRCSYCAYPTYRLDDDLILDYIKALEKEVQESLNRGLEISSIYIGGGTPSSIGWRNLEKIIKLVESYNSEKTEFTVEIGRPDTIDKNILDVLKYYFVDRISINPQTMNDKTLKSISRAHTSEDIKRAFFMAREMEFNNINMDLIMELPGEISEDFKHSLFEISKLDPESLTIHALSLKKSSEIRLNGVDKKYGDDFSKIRDEFINLTDYEPYYLYRQKNINPFLENIGYTKPGYESIYNIAMMEDINNIIGFGMSSTTKILQKNGLKKHMNHRNIKDYIENIDKDIKDKLILMEELY